MRAWTTTIFAHQSWKNSRRLVPRGSATLKSRRRHGRLGGQSWRQRFAVLQSHMSQALLNTYVQLLDHEPKPSDQVPLLLNMKEDRLALTKAVESGDTDLGLSTWTVSCRRVTNKSAVYHVLLHLQKRLPLGNFFRLIEEGGPSLVPASKLLQVYARAQDREMLRDFYYSDDRRVDSATLSLSEAATMVVRAVSTEEIVVILTIECSGSCCESQCCESCPEVLLRRQGTRFRGEGTYPLPFVARYKALTLGTDDGRKCSPPHLPAAAGEGSQW